MRHFIVNSLSIFMLALPVMSEPLIRIGEEWRYLLATEAPSNPPDLWRQLHYDDSNWLSGTSGFYSGFGVVREATPIFGLGIDSSTVLFRKTFHVESPESILWPILRLDYQHGFAAYLNGQPLIQRQLGADLAPNIPIDLLSAPHFAGVAAEFDLSLFRDLLVPGENILAVQMHSNSLGNPALVFAPELLANFTRGPLIQNLTSHSVKIVWRTHLPTFGSVAYGTTENLGLVNQETTPSIEHVITLSNLSPGTQYHYQIQSQHLDNTAASKIHAFRTMRETGPVRFAVLSDSGTGSKVQFDISHQIRKWSPDLVLHAGDVVYPDFTEGRADLRCFSVYGPDMAERPYFFAAGNHDVNLGIQGILNAFHHPTNDTSEPIHQIENTAPELYYSFDHGDAHFTVLYVPFFSQYALKENNPQYQWLEKDLQQSTKPWKFLLLHHNVFSSSAHTFDDWDRNGVIDQEELQSILIPLASRYGVQMVFSGHDHVFERSAPTRGIHFVTSAGGGGGIYSLTRRLPGSAQFWRRNHFVGATISDSELTLEAIDSAGNVFDRMYFRKQSPTPTHFTAAWNTPHIEIVPGSPLTDGNIRGQTYDLIGSSVTSVTGKESSLGRITVNHDQGNLYLGLEQTMFRTNQIAYLLLETNPSDGVTGLPIELPEIETEPLQTLQALALTEALAFTHFTPNFICLLGDEFADRSVPHFLRPSSTTPLGQGVFSLSPPGNTPLGSRIQQFDHSPLSHNKPNEQNSNLIEISIPKSALQEASIATLTSLKIAALVGIVDEAVSPPLIRFDTGYIAAAFESSPEGKSLSPLTVQLEPNPDADFDGLLNEIETAHGTNPFNPDTDSDRLPDGWEVTHQLSPVNSEGEDSNLGDPDQDGVTNFNEYQAGTDPQDPNSLLKLHADHLGNGIIRVTWQATSNIRYTLESSASGHGPYETVREWFNPQQSAPTPLEYFDLGSSESAQFYRLKAKREP
jgi:hypothetical protein